MQQNKTGKHVTVCECIKTLPGQKLSAAKKLLENHLISV
jgi:hypothetical protein